ncbi:MAG TPA: hypothetical protein VGG39_07345 [Polyangiaceae bacterium]
MGPIDDDEKQPRRREPTEEERAAFEEMLLGHDIEGARLRALRCAMKRVRGNAAMARQMADDAVRIAWERCTWDPKRVTLGKYLAGIVRSEWSNKARDGLAERERAEEYMAEQETVEGAGDASLEQRAVEQEERNESEDEAVRALAVVRAALEKNGDTVGLQAIDFMLDGVDEPAEMARLSGRPVEDFYRAADRRTRLVRQLRSREKKR